MTKKLITAVLAFSLVFAAGCGKKDKAAETDLQTGQQQQQQQNSSENNDRTSKIDGENEIIETDASDVTQEELESLVETFNSETASEEEKEQARLKLEEILKNAEQNQ